MRICLVSPHFKPRPGGVSDHSYELAQHLHELGHDVYVLTSSDVPVDSFSFTILKQSNWAWNQVFIIKEKVSSLDPDLVIFQWTPLAFGPKEYGLAFHVPFLLSHLKAFNTQVIVHESHYPVLFNLKGLLIGLPHFIQFCLISIFAHKLYFSHEGNERKWKSFLPFFKDKFNTLPVYSNILNLSQGLSLEKSFGNIPLKKYKLLYFGGAHPTNSFEHLLKGLNMAQEEFGAENVSLYIIGLSKETVPSLLKSRLNKDIFALGFLSEENVSLWIKEADLLLCPFVDGVTTRRGTIMAGLIHGRPIITTKSYFTVDTIPWSEFLYVCPFDDLMTYGKLIIHALKNPDEANDLGNKGSLYYKDNFSVEAVSKTLLA